MHLCKSLKQELNIRLFVYVYVNNTLGDMKILVMFVDRYFRDYCSFFSGPTSPLTIAEYIVLNSHYVQRSNIIT